MESKILTDYYHPMLAQNHFRPVPCPAQFSRAGSCWEIAPACRRGISRPSWPAGSGTGR